MPGSGEGRRVVGWVSWRWGWSVHGALGVELAGVTVGEEHVADAVEVGSRDVASVLGFERSAVEVIEDRRVARGEFQVLGEEGLFDAFAGKR